MLTFLFGTMAAGKSLELLALAHNLQEEKIPFIILKSSIDNRDGEGIIHSRAIPGGKPCVIINKTDNIVDVISKNTDIERLKYILVDEVQFLEPEQIEEFAYISDTYGIFINCYGLKTDFKTKLFPASQRLFEIADNFVLIDSFCHYEGKTWSTAFNARIDKDGNFLVNGKQIEVGGEERYKAVSRKEYFEKTNNPFYNKI